jgi:hypothetical protein
MKEGIIYCIKSLNCNLIYIGSSKQSIASRKAKHIYDSKHNKRCKPVHRMILDNGGFNNFQIKVIKKLMIYHYFIYMRKKIEDYKNNDNKLMKTYC